MSHAVVRTIAALVAVTALSIGRGDAAERFFQLTEDGKTFIYTTRPGDHPSGVAEMFGVPLDQLDAFLASNRITDATRVGPGFVYRIPNVPARALGERVVALEAESARLAQELARVTEQAGSLGREAETARGTAAEAEARAERAARLVALWPWVQAGIVLLVIAVGAAGAIAHAAARRQVQAERYARTLARELEEKRQGTMAERQESGRRIVDLENRIRALEAQLGPRVVISGRG